MKRIISLCCVALIFVFSLAAPVKADDPLLYIDALDYTTLDGDNYFSFTTSSTKKLDLPDSQFWMYIDITFIWTGLAVSSVTAGNGSSQATLNLQKINSRMYRAYGAITARAYSEITLVFNNAGTSATNVSLQSVRLYKDGYNVFDASCSVTGRYGTTDFSLSRAAGATTNPVLNYYGDSSIPEFQYYFYLDDWRLYDYIEFQVFVRCSEINSISAMCGDQNLSVTADYSHGIAFSDFIALTLTVDIRNCLRFSNSPSPYVLITGCAITGDSINMLTIVNSSGIVETAIPDQNVFLFEKLFSKISSHFSNLNTWINTQTTAIQTQFTNLSTWITTQTTAIETQFTQLKTSVDNRLVQIYSLIDAWGELNYQHFDNLFTDLSNWIQVQTNTLESAIRGDTSSGNQFQQEVQQELNELDQAQAVMDSVTKPAIEDINVSVDQYVSQADIQVLASPMAVFFEGEIFSKVIIMSILLATVSYTLYGKK